VTSHQFFYLKHGFAKNNDSKLVYLSPVLANLYLN
jgi:hypothetical protein